MGSPPKIPGCACLIFIMEIVKINGDKKPANIVFPEWSEEQLKLWEEKDEKSLVDWREAKEKSYAEGLLKEKYPERADFDAWMEKQCSTQAEQMDHMNAIAEALQILRDCTKHRGLDSEWTHALADALSWLSNQ